MAITLDSVGTPVNGGGVTSLSTSHTAAGSNRLATITVYHEGTTVSSISYGAQTPTLIRTHSTSPLSKYRLIAPATGAQTVQVNFAGSSSRCALAVVTRNGVHQTTPLGTDVENVAENSNTISVNVSSAAGEVVEDAAVFAETTIVVGAGQTVRHDLDDFGGTFRSLGVSDEPGAGTVTMSWTTGSATDGAIIAVPIKPAAESSSVTVDHAQATFQGAAIPLRYTAPLINAQATFQGQNVGTISGGSQVGAVVHGQATWEGQQIPFIWSHPSDSAEAVFDGGDINFEVRIKGFFADAAWQGQTVGTTVNNSRVEPVIGAQAVFAGSVIGLTQTGSVNLDDMVEDFKPQVRPMTYNITDTDSR